MSDSGILGDQVAAAVRAACIRARDETLKAGVPVFYREMTAGIDVMEQPDGRKLKFNRLRVKISNGSEVAGAKF